MPFRYTRIYKRTAKYTKDDKGFHKSKLHVSVFRWHFSGTLCAGLT